MSVRRAELRAVAMRLLPQTAPLAVVLGGAAHLFAKTLEFEYPRVPGRLGPDAWPQAILVLLMITCAVGIVARILAARSPRPAQAGATRPGPSAGLVDEPGRGPSRYGLVVAGIGLFAAYPLALELTGFLVATFLLMAVLMIVGQWRSPVGVLAVSALGTLALFYVFRGVVYISLPLGRPPFQDWTIWVASLLGMR